MFVYFRMSLSRFQAASRICQNSTRSLPIGKSFHILFICQSQPSNVTIKEEVKNHLQMDGFTFGECIPGLSTFDNIVQTCKSAVTIIPLITKEFLKSADCNKKLEIAQHLHINSGDKQQPFIIPLLNFLDQEHLPNAIMTINCIDMAAEPLEIWYPRLKKGLNYAMETYRNKWITTFDLVTDLPSTEKEKLGAALLNERLRDLTPRKEIEIASDLMKDKTYDEKLLFLATLFETDVVQAEKLIRIIANPVANRAIAIQTDDDRRIQVENNDNTTSSCTSRSWIDIISSLTKIETFAVFLFSMFAVIGFVYVCSQLPALARLMLGICFGSKKQK